MPILFACWAAAFLVGYSGEAASAPDSTPDEKQAHGGDWYVFVAAVNVYPRLKSEDIIDDLLEPVLRGLAPGHGGVRTIGELRDEHKLWPPHIGLGYNLNDRWSVFLEAGYTVGKVHTKRKDRSILLLPLHTNFEIKRSALFAGLGLDYFPWGMPALRDYDGLRSRLAEVRPFFGTRLTWTHATYRAKTKLGFRPLPNFVNLELSDAWTISSTTVVAGFDVPVSKNTALTVNTAYNHFWSRDFDFGGWALTLEWKYFFRGPRLFGDNARRSPAKGVR